MDRMIDANFNRAREGLRVIEDVLRFQLNSPLFEEIKTARHQLKDLEISNYTGTINKRDAIRDLGNKIYQEEVDRKHVKNLITANFKRVEESLRVLEEVFKLEKKEGIAFIKKLRYQVYALEKKIILLLQKSFDLSLYLITDSRLNKNPLDIVVESAIKSGVTLVQLREKYLTDKKIIEIGKKVKKICDQYSIPLIIDDRPDICLILDAAGVHIGQDDLPVKSVRKILGEAKIIGKSTHSMEQVKNAVAEDIDYFAFGPLFKTPTKDYLPVGLDLIEEVKNISEVSTKPVVFIGGISKDNIEQLTAKNVRTIAVVREIMEAPDLEKSVSFLKNKIKGLKA